MWVLVMTVMLATGAQQSAKVTGIPDKITCLQGGAAFLKDVRVMSKKNGVEIPLAQFTCYDLNKSAGA